MRHTGRRAAARAGRPRPVPVSLPSAFGAPPAERRRSAEREVRDERSKHPPAARLQAGQQGPLRHGGEPVRRPRRVDQHHAAHPAGVRLRGHPPRPQPVGRGDRQLRDPGRRARHRDLVLPGRARRVLQVHARPAARARRRPHQGVRRRRRRDRRRPRSRSCTTTASRASSRPRTARSSACRG